MGILILLLIAAAIFGIGGVLEGLFWAVIIGIVLLVAAGIAGARALGGGGAARRT